jgi:amidase
VSPAAAGEPLTSLAATEIAARVRRRELSPGEVVAAFLRRIDEVEPRVAAFVALRRAEVEREAAALAARPDLGELPLAGVPIAVKDVFRVAGLPRRLGSRATSAEPSTEDSELVARVRRAGALVIGLTSMPELALWPHGAADVYGKVTGNPWDLERTPGGSSAGSAAAVAARMAPIAIGSDGLGSIRIPAACCGVVGLKPGAGVIPPGDVHPWFGHSESGPIAATVADAALLFAVLSGQPWQAPEPPAPLRIAVTLRAPAHGIGVDRELRAAAERVAALLAGAGHAIELVPTPRSLPLSLALLRRWCAFAADDVARLDLDPDRLEPLTQIHLRRGRRVLRRRPPADAEVERARELFAGLFADRDLVLQPALARLPPPTASFRAGWTRSILRMTGFTPFTPTWNLARYPAISVPAGLGSAGLPLAVMLGGPPGSEGRLLAVAQQLESLAPWPRHAPL